MAFSFKQIFDELCKNKAVLCDKCSTDLDGVSVIYKKLKDADRYYFEPKRNETRTKATATETNEIQAETKHQANKIKVEAPKSAEYVKCSFCKKILSKRDLKEHVDMTHLKVTKFRCHLCSRGFSYKHQFNNHINHCIADLKYEDRPHKCNHKDCEKFFISSLHLKLHQLTHSGMHVKKLLDRLNLHHFLILRRTTVQLPDPASQNRGQAWPRVTSASSEFHFQRATGSCERWRRCWRLWWFRGSKSFSSETFNGIEKTFENFHVSIFDLIPRALSVNGSVRIYF